MYISVGGKSPADAGDFPLSFGRGGWKCGIIVSMKNLMFFAFCAAMALLGCVELTAGRVSSRVAITGLEVNRLERP